MHSVIKLTMSVMIISLFAFLAFFLAISGGDSIGQWRMIFIIMIVAFVKIMPLLMKLRL